MRHREVKEFLSASKTPHAEADDRTRWLEGRDIPSLLSASLTEDVPIYVSGDPLYMYSAFVPEEKIAGDWMQDGLKWNFSVPQGWGYGYHNDSDGRRTQMIFPPLDHTRTQLLEGAEPTIFLRGLEGRGDPYLELDQRFAHVNGIHRFDDRHAYSKLNQSGDLDDVVVMDHSGTGWLCTAKRSALDFYMFLTGSVLIRVFEVIRPFPSWASESDRKQSIVSDPSGTISARQILATDASGALIGGLLRGLQLVRRTTDDEKLWKVAAGEPCEEKQYATFIIHDWKHERIIEWSCSPDKLGNYFVKSDLPYSTSPAFFRPEVLSRYKQDPDKYELDVRHVHCRGSWYLRSYDINEEGQVHVYIGDLGDLPLPEQLNWKAFNEPPKAGISRRAFLTDFEASWDVEPDPLWELKGLLREFPLTGDGRVVWSTRSTDTAKALGSIQYVVTDSSKEWRDAILDLCRVIVDGLESSTLRELAVSLGCDDRKLGSLKLLRRVLDARAVDGGVVAEVCDPLDELQSERSGKAAHGVSNRVPSKPRDDFRSRLTLVARSVARLVDLVRAGVLDLSRPEEEPASR